MMKCRIYMNDSMRLLMRVSFMYKLHYNSMYNLFLWTLDG